MLIVEGETQYNDSITAAFGQLAASGGQGSAVAYSYLDGAMQAGFLVNFEQGTSQGGSRGVCGDGKILARRVS